MKERKIHPVVLGIGTFIATSVVFGANASVDDESALANAWSDEIVAITGAHGGEGECGEGDDKHDGEGSCGEGQCGDENGDDEADEADEEDTEEE